MNFVVFVAAAAMVLVGAVGVVVRPHPVHAALSLILTLFGVAVLFVLQQAHFIAAVEVIVYAGAIVVLFLFVIMLLGVDKIENISAEPFKVQRPLAGIIGLGMLSMLVAAVVVARNSAVPPQAQSEAVTAVDAASGDANITRLARDLFGDRVLAFELTSVLLVIAVVGTVLLARRPEKLASEQGS
jgi:NADH-quinone oxidoreductase subunit J